MIYTIGEPSDQAEHLQFHKSFLSGVTFPVSSCLPSTNPHWWVLTAVRLCSPPAVAVMLCNPLVFSCCSVIFEFVEHTCVLLLKGIDANSLCFDDSTNIFMEAWLISVANKTSSFVVLNDEAIARGPNLAAVAGTHCVGETIT